MKTYNDIENLVGRLRHEDMVKVSVDNLNNITSWYYAMFYDDDCGLRLPHCNWPISHLNPNRQNHPQ